MSAKTKNALKISIAMVIAYGIALQMNWSNPYWAGFAVIMISLATVGQSLNKAAMRLLGTLAAAVAALSIIALFPQQRWMFMVILSIYIAFCSYMNLGKKYQYFYFVCGFVCIIICFDGGVEPVNAFKTATLRVLETGVGIISYTLVNLFIWPKNSSGDLNNASCKLFAIQIKLFSAYLQLMTDKAAEGDTQSLRVDEIQLLNKLNQALNAAETDSYKVWEVRHQWEYYLNLEARMMETLERWRESFPEIKNLDLKKYLPNMEIFCSELNERFSQIETLLEGKKSEQFLHAITLTIDKNEEASLSHFEKAAVTLTKTHLNNIEKISRSMFEYLQYIKGFNQSLPLPLPDLSNSLFKSKLSLEPDRITATVRVVVTMWVAFLLFIYFRVPGNTGFIVMATVLAMVFSSMPYLPVSSLVFPVAVSWVFGSFLYIFIMPSLSGFVELGLLILQLFLLSLISSVNLIKP